MKQTSKRRKSDIKDARSEHEPGNLRLLRRWANTRKPRTEQEIAQLRDWAIALLFDPSWPRVDWQCQRKP